MAKEIFRRSVGQSVVNKSGSTNVVGMMLREKESESTSKERYVSIDVDDITPRPVNRYSQTRIERLAKSIRDTNNRLINPIVLVRGKDLPEDSEIYQLFLKNGKDPKEVKYIIVSGERRYRAWKLLREEEEELGKDRPSFVNPFDFITANVLTEKEAKKEEIFFEDANLQTRQLTTLEVLLHVKDALSELETKTVEEKNELLLEMGYDPASKKFNEAEYCKFYIENEIGLTDKTLSTIKINLMILKGCSEKLLDAVINEYISVRAARDASSLKREVQDRIAEVLYNEGKERFSEELEKELQKKKSPKNKRKNFRDARKTINDFVKSASKGKKELDEIYSQLGDSDRQSVEEALKALDMALDILRRCSEQLKD